MRSVEAILSEKQDEQTRVEQMYPHLVDNLSQHTIELDLDALERAGKWGAARVNIAGKIYQLFPVEAA